MSRPEVIVVGDGIIGSAVAFALSSSGREFILLAPSQPAGDASRAAGAMLGVLGEVVDRADDELELRAAADARYPSWLNEIEASGGERVPLGFGTFVVANSRRASDLESIAAMEKAGAQLSLPVERVDYREVEGLAPAPGYEPATVLALPQEAFVDAPRLRAELAHAIDRSGRATRIDDIATRVQVEHGRVRGLETATHGLLEADEVVICAGVATAGIVATSPDTADVIPALLASKGASIVLCPPAKGGRAPFEHVLRTPNREFACGLHLVPRGDGLYVGATNRVSRFIGVTGTVTASDLIYLLDGVTNELSVDLEQWDLATSAYGYRPLSADGQAIAGRTSIDGLSVATGTYRNGVLLAPLLADAVMRGLASTSPDTSSPLSPKHPKRGSRAGHDPFAKGLAELEFLLEDAGAAWWRARLQPIRSALAALEESDENAAKLRRHASDLMDRYPRPEMVPEVLVELLQLPDAIPNPAESEGEAALGTG